MSINEMQEKLARIEALLRSASWYYIEVAHADGIVSAVMDVDYKIKLFPSPQQAEAELRRLVFEPPNVKLRIREKVVLDITALEPVLKVQYNPVTQGHDITPIELASSRQYWVKVQCDGVPSFISTADDLYAPQLYPSIALAKIAGEMYQRDMLRINKSCEFWICEV